YYAPDCVQGPDGRYYLYYFVVNSSIISVAVCDKPAGKYEYLGDVSLPDGHAYGTKPEEWFTFDPAVLVDDDGRIWL
ncbi:alpha-N-arabinofuranosidase, partial [Lachnospiraceae bacterium]|nr:alpha-N-arabinofuranosidase [Lachnospiraceae bacterium]